MKVFKVIAGVIVAAAAVVAVNTATAGATANECKFDYRGFGGQPYGLGQGFEKHPDVVSTGFWVKGDANCRMDITLTVWKIPHETLQPYPEEEQTYFSHVTKTLKPGFHVLATKVPDCFWQADLVHGKNPTGPNGMLPYEDGRMINSTLGGDKKCEEPEEPKDVCPNIDGSQGEVPEGHEVDGEGNCVVPEEPETPEEPEEGGRGGGEVKGEQKPTVLPETGAGAIATFFGVSTSAGVAHAIIRRFKKW